MDHGKTKRSNGSAFSENPALANIAPFLRPSSGEFARFRWTYRDAKPGDLMKGSWQLASMDFGVISTGSSGEVQIRVPFFL